jgi:hypothetical protein
MPKPPKPANTAVHKLSSGQAPPARKEAARPGRDAGGWAPASKPPDQRFEARRKLPSGPIGGSGRKTNVSRSS